MQEHHFVTQRTARYFTIGEFSVNTKTVWLACHGYGQLAGEFIKELQPLAADDAVIVAPEALSRFYTKGFFGTVGATWMTKEDRLAEIDDYVHYLQSLYELISGKIASSARVNVMGFSQGCSTVCRWIARKAPALGSLWLCSGSIPDDMDYSLFSKAIRYPAHYIMGDDDPFIGARDREAAAQRIKEHRVPVEMHTFHGGHDLNLALIKSLL
jgi:predicted esterase